MPEKDEPISEVEAAEDETETALLPRSFFQGKNIEVGKKCEIRVEGIFDDEIEVSYVKHKKSKDGKDKDSEDDDDDDDKPKRRRERDDSDLMRESLSQMDTMAAAPPSMGGY